MLTTLKTITKSLIVFSQKSQFTLQTYSFFKTYNSRDILSNKEYNIYRKLFDKMDSNNDGLLTKEDLKKGLRDFVNYSANEEELKETMDVLDTDKDGNVGFEDFISYIAWSRQVRTEEAIQYAFKMFDRNSDGKINREELKDALISIGLVPNDSLLNNIMLLTDRDNDGSITIEEFRKIFYSKDITQ